MKAQFVFENIEFERGRDPKETMGIGRFSQRDFDSFEEAVDFAYHYFPVITGYSDESVFGKENDLYQEDALDRLSDFLSDINIKGSSALSYIDLPRSIYKKLKKEGFPTRVNEGVNFERTGNPKAGLDIGGVRLSYIRKEIIDQAREDWIQWIHDYILGKTITGKFNKVAERIEDGWEFTGENWGDYTVKVKELVNPDTIAMDNHALFVIGEDGGQYVVPIDDKKIWIKS